MRLSTPRCFHVTEATVWAILVSKGSNGASGVDRGQPRHSTRPAQTGTSTCSTRTADSGQVDVWHTRLPGPAPKPSKPQAVAMARCSPGARWALRDAHLSSRAGRHAWVRRAGWAAAAGLSGMVSGSSPRSTYPIQTRGMIRGEVRTLTGIWKNAIGEEAFASQDWRSGESV